MIFSYLLSYISRQQVMATRPTRSRKRRHRSLDSDVIRACTHSPPSKRRRLTTSVLPSRSSSKQYEDRQHWMRDNLTKLRNDNKISDVTFVLPAKSGTLRTDPEHSEHNNDPASLSDDDQPSNTTKTFKCIRALFAAVCFNSFSLCTLLCLDFML